VLNLLQELASIVDTLSAEDIPYALCGGLAMSVHGFTRATEDMDLLVRAEDVERLEHVVAPLGYVVKAKPMNFSSGAMKIRRVSKIDPSDGDLLMLDLLLVTDATAAAWSTRETRQWNEREISVVSRGGLILLKRFRSSDQDLVDIARLENE
jgi:hypothetical protein